jgi:lactoylglutathione lyase
MMTGELRMIKTLWSITFYVSDLKKATRFYEKTLGLEKKYEFSSYVGFECGGVEIGLIPKPKEQSSGTSSPAVGFLVDNVDGTYADLKAKDVKFINELHDETWGGRQASFKDPDGNILEVTQIDWKKYFDVSAKGAKKLRRIKTPKGTFTVNNKSKQT